MGRMQLRYGPNRAGPYGLLQPIADLVKLIRKESFFPAAAIDMLYIVAPFLAAFTALTTFSVIPWGPGWEIAGYQVNGYVADLPIALLLDLRDRLARDLRVHHRRLGVRLEVRAPRLDAHVRAARLVRGLARAVGARRRADGRLALARRHRRRAGRRRLVRDPAVRRLRRLHPRRHRRDRRARRSTCPRPSRSSSPGYHTEYGGMRFGLFSMSEYINLITLSGLAVTLFLGGWHGPWLPGAGLVPAQAVRAALRLHLDAHDAAAAPLRPADALRLEGAAARRDGQRRHHRAPRGVDLG